MAHAKVDTIEIEDTPVLLQPAFAPGLELLLEILVEPTDGTGTWGHSQQGLGHCSYFVGACAGHEHLGEALSDLGLIATIALEDLSVELTFTISGHAQVLNPTRGGHQITCIVPIAISFTLGTALPPADSDERVEFLTHHVLQQDANGAAGQFTQMLPKFVLIGQSRGRLPLC
jgi:hypothetical protein